MSPDLDMVIERIVMERDEARAEVERLVAEVERLRSGAEVQRLIAQADGYARRVRELEAENDRLTRKLLELGATPRFRVDL